MDISNVWGTAKTQISDAIENVNTKINELLRPEIVVTMRGGDLSCTSSDGNVLKTKKDGNVWTFTVDAFGKYNLVGEWQGLKSEIPLTVDTVKRYAVDCLFYDDVFGNNSWEVIKNCCENNVVPDTWKVGDYKDKICIIGKNHDKYADGSGKKAPLTFMTYILSSAPMNSTDSNSCGWTESVVRTDIVRNLETSTDNDAKYLLTNGILNYVKPVKKYTSAGNKSSTIVETSDTFFLFSEVEYTGEANQSFEGEGSRYERFVDDENRLTVTNQCDSVWLRSPYKSSTSQFLYQYTPLNAAYAGIKTASATSNEKFCRFGFCF